MPRRRVLPFGAYARRHWRAIGLVIVLMASTLLLHTMLDRGHEPVWRREPGDVAAVAVDPDGRTVFAVREEDGRVVGFTGLDAKSGEVLWKREVNWSGPALVTAGREWFAVATPFPEARLAAFHARGGNVLFDAFPDAEPRAIAADEDRLAVALRSGRVIVYDSFQVVLDRATPPVVSALDAAAGRVAIGTAAGNVLVLHGSTEIVNTTRPLHVQTMRFAAGGSHLVVGGRAPAEGDLGGVLEPFDLTAADPSRPAWSASTRARVSLLDMSDDGRFVLAVAETAPKFTVSYWDVGAGPEPLWRSDVDGGVFRNDPGSMGGAALSADGRYAAFGPDLGGDLTVVDGVTRAVAWSYRTAGVTSVSFAPDGSGFVANARLTANRPFDAVLFFEVAREPVIWRYPSFPLALAGLEAVAGAVGIGVAYWRFRRR